MWRGSLVIAVGIVAAGAPSLLAQSGEFSFFGHPSPGSGIHHTAEINPEDVELSALPAEQAASADAFIDSIGVGTHLTYTDTDYYTQWPKIYDALTSLGVRHIRDGFYDFPEGTPYVSRHQELAAAGIHCTYVVPLNSSTTPQTIERIAPQVHDMEALEAPNECDVPGNCGGDGISGVMNMLGFLPTLTAAADDLHLPVVGPSFTQPSSYFLTGLLSPEITDSNLHIYFGGRNPGSQGWGDFDADGNSYGSFAFWIDQANIDAPNLPVVITETGYIARKDNTTPYNLPESVEASYIPRTLLLSFKHGVKKTILYELIDEKSSPGYGLMRADLTPKPAYTAIQNLVANLSDPGPAYQPGKLSFTLEGGGPSLNHLLLEKHDGSFWLVLWLEESSYDQAAATPAPVTAQKVTLTLANPDARQLLQWDESGQMHWSNVTMHGNQLSLLVSDQVSIVKMVR